MIENYFKEGVRFDWAMPGAIDAGSNKDGTIVDSIRAPTPMTYIGLSDIVAPEFGISSPAQFGLTMNMSIPYRWCDFVGGRTARRAIGGMDILTGPMSGCWILRYTDNGAPYVAHIGTVGVPSVDSQVKKKAIVIMKPDTTGFNPFDAWHADMVAVSQRHGKALQFIALVTAAGQFYAIAMLVDPTGNHINRWVCGGSKLVPAVAVGTLRQRLGMFIMGSR